jgi:cytochrome c oxidase cbb3-type subunit I
MADVVAGPEAAVLEAPTPREMGPPEPRALPFPDSAARHWLLASVVWLTVVDLFGFVLTTEFISPETFGGVSWLAFSRIRPAHVNGVILAWLSMMYFGALFYMLPRLCGTRGMWSERLGVWCAWAWSGMYGVGSRPPLAR